MGPQSPGWPGLILSERFRTRGWIARRRQKGWKKDYGFCGTGLAGEKVGRKDEGQAGRIGYHPEGCESLVLGSLRHFFFLPSSIFFSLSLRILLSRPYPRPIRPCDLDSRQCRIILRYAILITFIPLRKCFDAV